MRIFKNKHFYKWASDIGLDDKSLLNAANEIAAGKYEASLGQKIFKKRIALNNTGKSGSTRTVIAFQQGSHVFYMYGYAKNQKANMTRTEIRALQKLAQSYFELSDKDLCIAVKAKILKEIKHEATDNG